MLEEHDLLALAWESVVRRKRKRLLPSLIHRTRDYFLGVETNSVGLVAQVILHMLYESDYDRHWVDEICKEISKAAKKAEWITPRKIYEAMYDLTEFLINENKVREIKCVERRIRKFERIFPETREWWKDFIKSLPPFWRRTYEELAPNYLSEFLRSYIRDYEKYKK